jgi:hypothetical protein
MKPFFFKLRDRVGATENDDGQIPENRSEFTRESAHHVERYINNSGRIIIDLLTDLFFVFYRNYAKHSECYRESARDF